MSLKKFKIPFIIDLSKIFSPVNIKSCFKNFCDGILGANGIITSVSNNRNTPDEWFCKKKFNKNLKKDLYKKHVFRMMIKQTSNKEGLSHHESYSKRLKQRNR